MEGLKFSEIANPEATSTDLNTKEITAKESGHEMLIETIKQKASQIRVKLAIVLVGKDPSSEAYVNSKIQKGEELGIEVELHHIEKLSDDLQKRVLDKIESLNNDDDVNGIIVQVPSRQVQDQIKQTSGDSNLDFDELKSKVQKDKDVDGLSDENKIARKDSTECFVPATALGILYLLKKNGIELENKEITVVGAAGDLVGAPISDLLEREKANVNRMDPRIEGFSTEEQIRLCVNSDIIILATSIPHLATPDWFRKDKTQIVIDAGFSRFTPKDLESLKQTNNYNEIPEDQRIKYEEKINNGKTVSLGNLHPNCYQMLKAYNPPTGSTGPMTVAFLFYNTVNAAIKQISK